MWKGEAGIALVFILALVGAPFAIPRSGSSPPTRLYVVAVHDSSLFTFCPPELRTALASRDFRHLRKLNYIGDAYGFLGYQILIEADGRLCVILSDGWIDPSVQGQRSDLWVPPPFVPEAPGILERSRPDWQELSAMVRGICPSGWEDPGMQEAIETELKKRKDYELVDSAEKADLVFLVEGLYHTYLDPKRGSLLNYSVSDTFFAGKPLCQAAIGVLMPSKVYQHDPTDGGALLQAALWTGVSIWERASSYQTIVRGVDPYLSTRSASIKELTSGFFKRAKWNSAIPPISPAWSIRAKAIPETVFGKPGAGVAGGSGIPFPPSEETKRVPSDNVIRTETVLVTVPVIASNVDGRLVPDLTISDFRIHENGVEQKIDRLIDESVPFHTALLMDTSRSTGFFRADTESAALAFVASLRPEDELMVLSLGNWILVDSEFTRDRSRLRSAITDSAARARTPSSRAKTTPKQQWELGRFDGTGLYDALDMTVTKRLNKVTGRKAILLITDGIDTGSRLATADSTLARIEESDVLVYIIKYDTPMPKTKYLGATAATAAAHARGAQYLQELSTNTGGRIFNASKGSDLAFTLSSIAEELRHQYTLCYYPTRPMDDSSFRRIQVTTSRPDIKIRARTGYRPVSTPSAAR